MYSAIKQNRNKCHAISKLHFASCFSSRTTAVAPSSSNTQKNWYRLQYLLSYHNSLIRN